MNFARVMAELGDTAMLLALDSSFCAKADDGAVSNIENPMQNPFMLRVR
jgi:hypothetical protein